MRRLVEDLAHQPQHVVAPPLRRQEQLDAVGDQRRADAVVVAQRGEGEQRRELGRELALEDGARAEAEAARDVDHQEDREVALLDVLLDERRCPCAR